MNQACVQLTKNALDALLTAMECNKDTIGVRFGIKSGGCQGLTYSIDYVTEKRPEDIHFLQNGVNIYVDPSAVLFIDGMVVDYKFTPIGSSFTFDNPNAEQRCGCGISFCSKNSRNNGGSCGGCQ